MTVKYSKELCIFVTWEGQQVCMGILHILSLIRNLVYIYIYMLQINSACN